MLFLHQFTESKSNGKIKNVWNKYIIPNSLLILLILIVSIITYYRVLIQIDIGPLSDACDFLLNALHFSGQGVGYYDWTRPPFFPFIVSLVFRFGFISATTIFIIDGLFLILGVIGFYLFLNLHFNKIESFFGGLLFATFPEIVILSGLGYSDFACCAFLIWAFYFLVLAVKKNSKFFILFFPLLMMAFLTRFNAALMIFPLILYFFMNRNVIKNYKNIGIGLITSFIILIPVLTFYYVKFNNIFFPFISTFNTSTTNFSSQYYHFDPNIYYFIEHFFTFTGFQTILIIFLIIVGLSLIILKNKYEIHNKFINIWNLKNKALKFKLTIFAILSLLFIITFGQIHYMISEVIFLVIGVVVFTLIKNLKIKDIDLHLLVLLWFMVFFIFNSVYVIKSVRYFILIAPAVAYFLLLGLRVFASSLPMNIRNIKLIFPILYIILTVIILFSTVSILPDIQDDNQKYKYSNEQIALASQWFSNYEPNYKNKIIYSDLWPYLAWFLKTDVKIMPAFKDNQSYVGGVKNITFTPQDSIAFNTYLVENNADYYFCDLDINLTSYKPIKQFGRLIIYQRI